MLKEIIFGISSIKGPTWLKEFNENNKQLEDLKILSEKSLWWEKEINR